MKKLIAVLWGLLVLLAFVPNAGASREPTGSISAPIGDVRLGGDVEYVITTDGIPGEDKDHYRTGAWAMVSTFCWQDRNEDGVVETTITSPDVVYGMLVKPYHEADGTFVAEFPLFGYYSDWSNDLGGSAVCEGVLWQYTKQGVITELASTGFFAAAG